MKTTCNGKIDQNGFCEKCYQTSQTTSGYCSRLIDVPELQFNSEMKDLNKIVEYMQHKSWCNTTSNWDEAIQAMGDTPEKDRDESWQLAYDEMRKKMKICNCGLNTLVQSLQSQQPEVEQPSAEEIADKVLTAHMKKFNLFHTNRVLVLNAMLEAMEEYAQSKQVVMPLPALTEEEIERCIEARSLLVNPLASRFDLIKQGFVEGAKAMQSGEIRKWVENKQLNK